MTDSGNNILNEIIENVKKLGSHDIPYDDLANTVFKRSQNPDRTTKEQILIWAVERRLSYDYIDESSGTIVHFYRK